MNYKLSVKLASLIRTVAGNIPFTRKLPADLGGATIHCTLNTDIRFLLPSLEATADGIFDVAKFLVHPGNVVWDFGACVGLFSFSSSFLAGPDGRVLAVDASAAHCRMLLQAATRLSSRHAPVDVLCAAACDTEGFKRFEIVERGHTKNHLEGFGHQTAGQVKASCGVIGLSADWLLGQIPPPQVVKVDIEGAELLFLQGAPRLLKEIQPRILIEVSPELSDQCSALLHQAGYTLFDALADAQCRHPIEKCVFNTIALPS